jgi:two-component system chemotaxis sensor kinase CheA
MAATIGVAQAAAARAQRSEPAQAAADDGPSYPRHTEVDAVRETYVPPKPPAPEAAPFAHDPIPPPRPSAGELAPSEAVASSLDDARGGEDTLRVSTRKLGALMAQVGELLAARLRTDQRLSELKSILSSEEETVERLAAQRSTVLEAGGRDLELGYGRATTVLEEATNEHKQLVRRLRELVRSFEADALQSTILSGELQEDIRRIQTFPLSSVLGPMPRAVRNMAREAGKDVELAVVGGELELDKNVLEALRDPLYHLLRNAVDHGLEPVAERRKRGKPERGRIVLRAEHLGDSVTITVEDDGGGVDLDAVRKRARERGLLSEQAAAQAGEHALLELLFSPGFSTRRVVSSMSGRGVGLDAVRKNVEQLRGSVTMRTRRGVGTLASITLPLTIYVVHALILRVGADELAIPISSVQRILRVRPADVLSVEECPAILVDGRPVALVPLARLLGLDADTRPESGVSSVVVIGAGDQRCALAVDEIVGDQTVLAKNLEPPLVRVPNIAGATIRGDGSVLLALSPVDLLHRAAELRADDIFDLDRRVATERARLLLVDDSFTTRALERSVLEAAGFEVVAVASGEDALVELERDVVFDGVVSDVQMPGIDGFELTRRIRTSERHRGLPVVLVTSLASPEDRRRGLDAGADAYVVKAEFDHELLVARLRELLGRP